MKEFYICDCTRHENKIITSSFVVVSKQIKPKKSGEPYLALTLGDRSGQVEAKMWDNVEEVLNAFVVSFQNPHLKSLVQAFMSDPEIAAAYRNAPAAKTLHHAYIGGLLDHVVSLFRSCDLVCRNYPQVNRDLLLTGVFLHDIGKIHELAYNRSFSYTSRGQLLGHMIIELDMLNAKAVQVPGFPEELKILLEHLVISHHGHYEFGSPKLPMFPEALMLHYLDDLDSKMESMRAHFEREAETESSWTSYNPSLGRTLLNTAKFLKKEDKKEEMTAAVAAASGVQNAAPTEPPSNVEVSPAADALLPLAEDTR